MRQLPAALQGLFGDLGAGSKKSSCARMSDITVPTASVHFACATEVELPLLWKVDPGVYERTFAPLHDVYVCTGGTRCEVLKLSFLHTYVSNEEHVEVSAGHPRASTSKRPIADRERRHASRCTRVMYPIYKGTRRACTYNGNAISVTLAEMLARTHTCCRAASTVEFPPHLCANHAQYLPM